VHVVARQFAALWQDGSLAEHTAEAEAILAGAPPSTMPLVIFVAEIDGNVVGFAEVGLRSHADGCDARRAVGFLEGWYVDAEHRGRGVGRALVGAAEDWARSKGCREFASDTWTDNEASQRAHEALGFEVVDRCVNYKKTLG
jgi:aminoglycoside 6'-N-acetyltransferase I